MALLTDLINATGKGAGNIVLVQGPAGIGKSAVLEEARRLAGAAAFVVSSAQPDELDRITPMGPILAALGKTRPPVLTSGDLSRLRQLRHPGELVEAVGSIVEVESSRQPLAISVDDLQWAD